MGFISRTHQKHVCVCVFSVVKPTGGPDCRQLWPSHDEVFLNDLTYLHCSGVSHGGEASTSTPTAECIHTLLPNLSVSTSVIAGPKRGPELNPARDLIAQMEATGPFTQPRLRSLFVHARSVPNPWRMKILKRNMACCEGWGGGAWVVWPWIKHHDPDILKLFMSKPSAMFIQYK